MSERIEMDYAYEYRTTAQRAGRHSKTAGLTPSIRMLLNVIAEAQEEEPTAAAYRGATYRQLASLGHRVGMSMNERQQWYRVAEHLSLSEQHAGVCFKNLDNSSALAYQAAPEEMKDLAARIIVAYRRYPELLHPVIDNPSELSAAMYALDLTEHREDVRGIEEALGILKATRNQIEVKA